VDELLKLMESVRDLESIQSESDNKGANYSRKAMREAKQIVNGERRLIDSRYLWWYVLFVALGSGLSILCVGWVLRGLVG
jgi:hypothetical protein